MSATFIASGKERVIAFPSEPRSGRLLHARPPGSLAAVALSPALAGLQMLDAHRPRAEGADDGLDEPGDGDAPNPRRVVYDDLVRGLAHDLDPADPRPAVESLVEIVRDAQGIGRPPDARFGQNALGAVDHSLDRRLQLLGNSLHQGFPDRQEAFERDVLARLQILIESALRYAQMGRYELENEEDAIGQDFRSRLRDSRARVGSGALVLHWFHRADSPRE